MIVATTSLITQTKNIFYLEKNQIVVSYAISDWDFISSYYNDLNFWFCSFLFDRILKLFNSFWSNAKHTFASYFCWSYSSLDGNFQTAMPHRCLWPRCLFWRNQKSEEMHSTGMAMEQLKKNVWFNHCLG